MAKRRRCRHCRAFYQTPSRWPGCCSAECRFGRSEMLREGLGRGLPRSPSEPETNALPGCYSNDSQPSWLRPLRGTIVESEVKTGIQIFESNEEEEWEKKPDRDSSPSVLYRSSELLPTRGKRGPPGSVFQSTCKAHEFDLRWVRFIDGQDHLEKRCSVCGRFGGYAPKKLAKGKNLPSVETQRAFKRLTEEAKPGYLKRARVALPRSGN